MGSNAVALVLEGDGVHKIKLFLAGAKDCLIEQPQLFSLSKKRRLGCSQWLKVVVGLVRKDPSDTGCRLKCKHCCSGALKLRYQSWMIGSYMDDNTVKRAGTFLFNP